MYGKGKNENNLAKRTVGSTCSKEVRRNASLYVLVAIPILFLIVFSYAPMYGVQIAFKDYRPSRGIWESEWVGLRYFRQFLETPNFWKILWNTISLNLYGLLTFPLGIIFALLVNYLPLRRFVKTVQMVSYAPNFISTVVMVSMILQFFDARTGLFNAFTGLFGMEAVNYMGRPSAFAHIYVWSGVWQGLGYGSIIYISALANVSPELHEAAIVDGATIMKRIWHIDLPSLLPTISILFNPAMRQYAGYRL
ncbi:MAG: ABC transporter permease subunit [Clostridia bacterium]